MRNRSRGYHELRPVRRTQRPQPRPAKGLATPSHRAFRRARSVCTIRRSCAGSTEHRTQPRSPVLAHSNADMRGVLGPKRVEHRRPERQSDLLRLSRHRSGEALELRALEGIVRRKSSASSFQRCNLPALDGPTPARDRSTDTVRSRGPSPAGADTGAGRAVARQGELTTAHEGGRVHARRTRPSRGWTSHLRSASRSLSRR